MINGFLFSFRNHPKKNSSHDNQNSLRVYNYDGLTKNTPARNSRLVSLNLGEHFSSTTPGLLDAIAASDLIVRAVQINSMVYQTFIENNYRQGFCDECQAGG